MFFTIIYKLYSEHKKLMFLAFILEKSIFNITWFTLSENKFALVGNLLSVALIQLVNSLWVIGLREF